VHLVFPARLALSATCLTKPAEIVDLGFRHLL
jgi:hypothetical protein